MGAKLNKALFLCKNVLNESNERKDYMDKNNIKTIKLFDDEYPKKLKNIYDKPTVLFAKGNINLLDEKSVAIVGCRDCSDYGKNVAKKLSYDLAKENICIVSGLAKGNV